MSQPVTIYLIGFAGVGKYTIAKALEEHDFKIVDNHLVNNPIFSLLNLDGKTPIPKNIWDIIAEIRTSVLRYVSSDLKSNYIFTNELLEEKHDRIIYDQVKKSAEERGSIFIPIILHISPEEHAKRIENPKRKERFKETMFPKDRYLKGLINVNHPNLKKLVVTDLSVVEAAKKILEIVQKTGQ